MLRVLGSRGPKVQGSGFYSMPEPSMLIFEVRGKRAVHSGCNTYTCKGTVSVNEFILSHGITAFFKGFNENELSLELDI